MAQMVTPLMTLVCLNSGWLINIIILALETNRNTENPSLNREDHDVIIVEEGTQEARDIVNSVKQQTEPDDSNRANQSAMVVDADLIAQVKQDKESQLVRNVKQADPDQMVSDVKQGDNSIVIGMKIDDSVDHSTDGENSPDGTQQSRRRTANVTIMMPFDGTSNVHPSKPARRRSTRVQQMVNKSDDRGQIQLTRLQPAVDSSFMTVIKSKFKDEKAFHKRFQQRIIRLFKLLVCAFGSKVYIIEGKVVEQKIISFQ